ncbi:MAG TPA: hypothetical protein VGM44_14900 [Polyangiaceae bacterium]|jgi:hypothetical protein
MQKSRHFLLISLCALALGCGKSSADVLLAPNATESGGPPPDTDYLQTKTSGYGFTQIETARNNPIVALRTILMVPPLPTDSGTLFFSVGLQPGGQNFDPIDNGVLEPVLTWGPSCAPNSPSAPFTSWWIAAQYVNTYGNYSGYTGCHSGDGMFVEEGDPLSIHFSLDGTVWHQSVENLRDGASVGFDLDMLGQTQNYAHFWLNPVSAEPVADGEFASTTITFAEPERDACAPIQRGHNDFFSNPEPSPDGTQCSIDRIVLRAQGVPASTQN